MYEYQNGSKRVGPVDKIHTWELIGQATIRQQKQSLTTAS